MQIYMCVHVYINMCVYPNTKARPRAQPKGNNRQAEVLGTEFPPKGARHRFNFNHNNHKRNNHNHKRKRNNNHHNHNLNYHRHNHNHHNHKRKQIRDLGLSFFRFGFWD